ncbi:MAG: Hsp20/alpha crystallin family protein [Bdellovibrionales bacterium]|nr:Hsp20/alpha crystallin family protein [Bdellovibrionales bacterium]
MSIRDLVPWLEPRSVRRGERRTSLPTSREGDIFSLFQRDMDRMMSDFFSGFSPSRVNEGGIAFSPSINVEEEKDKIVVSAELPGMSQSDIDVQLEKDHVVLRGEKKFERKDESNGRSYYESSYGSFQRVIPLHVSIDEDKVDATLKDGVLKLVLPKSEGERSQPKRVSIR